MAIQTEPKPECPECGAEMRLKRPRSDQDWDAFWGCSTYPKCKGTLNIDSITGKPIEDEYRGDEGDFHDMF